MLSTRSFIYQSYPPSSPPFSSADAFILPYLLARHFMDQFMQRFSFEYSNHRWSRRCWALTSFWGPTQSWSFYSRFTFILKIGHPLSGRRFFWNVLEGGMLAAPSADESILAGCWSILSFACVSVAAIFSGIMVFIWAEQARSIAASVTVASFSLGMLSIPV
ncbi:hypothetical protein DFH11DRAFT_951558 [Phellopilus nigrolimitatus]|nr:hypothetical protein DFH11DRAFT_951558 [Phellopilus nigrolimitatus]